MAGSGLGDQWIQLISTGLGHKSLQLSSTFATLKFILAILLQYMPKRFSKYLDMIIQKIINHYNNNAQITFPEFSSDRLSKRSQLYSAIELYLSSLASTQARRSLIAHMSDKSKKPVFSMGDSELVTDEFLGVKVKWVSSKKNSDKISREETRFYKLIYPHSHRDIFTASYIQHVMEKAKEIAAMNRQRKLYTNTSGRHYGSPWSSVIFEHPASFETLAMDPRKKKEIIDHLKAFSASKDHYAKIGKAWKRGYLLYGPPGTGKSTIIACIANFLGYDVYDLELTAVKDNTQLRELLIDTSSKSVIVIEDIDCSLDLTGCRKKKRKMNEGKTKSTLKDKEKKCSMMTLSGLLNSVDGLWSGCGSEKIIIFTTNHLKDLDPALIRRGRMDKYIEMSYCDFEAFKVLAKNYLDIESHSLFDVIEKLLGDVNMTPADVAENLIPKCSDNSVAETCLQNLIEALRRAKMIADAKKAAQEEADAKKLAKRETEVKAGNGEPDAKAQENLNEQGNGWNSLIKLHFGYMLENVRRYVHKISQRFLA